ncbi:cell division protein ZapB [bacterium]|nr:cell division protein ZapB [bacterium]
MENDTLESFKVLESKIEAAADMIVKVRAEKKILVDENKELKDEIKMLYTKNEELSKEVDTLKDDKQNQGNFERVREEIGTRIDVMLEKLGEIDI